jgi:ABC-type transport system involved in multi-copper enzyme maturation permease subunit
MNSVFAIAGVTIKELVRRKDFYVLFVLTALIALLMASIRIFKEDALRGIQEICLLLIWLSGLMIALGTAARQMPAERDNRTIFPLLAKPVTRWQVLLGKFLGCWLACGGALVIFYVCFWLMSASNEHEWRVLNYFAAAWMQWMLLAVVIAMTLYGSFIFTAPSSNGTVVLLLVVGILLLGQHLNQIASEMGGSIGAFLYALLLALPQVEFFDAREMIFDRALPDWRYCAAVSLYGLIYAAAFLVAAWIRFRRKALQT